MVIFTTIFITGKNQVRLITNYNIPLQSGSVFYERAKYLPEVFLIGGNLTELCLFIHIGW